MAKLANICTSPDCCKNVVISDCNVVAGDDGIVLKTSYALNKKGHAKIFQFPTALYHQECVQLNLEQKLTAILKT